MGWGERSRGALEWLRHTPRTGDLVRDEQGRFLAGLLLSVLPCLLVLALWVIPQLLDPVRPTSTSVFRATAWLSLPATVGAYILNRRGALGLAVGLILLGWSLAIGWAASIDPQIVIFVPVVVVVTLAVLPFRTALVLCTAQAVLLPAAPVALGAATLAQVTMPFCLSVFLLPLFAVIESYHRRQEALRRVALEQSRRHLATTLSSIGDAVLTVDAAGAINFLNPVAEQLTGWSAREAEGQSIDRVFRIVSEVTGLPAESPVSKVLSSGKVVGLANHTLLISKDGARQPIADSGAPIVDSNGVISGVVLVFRDVSEQRAVQTRLEHSQRLDALGQLAGGVAHDFNNLLTVIGGSTELALEELDEQHGARGELESVREATYRAVALTSQLLAFSRRQVMQLSALELNATVTGAVAILGRLLKPNVRIETHLAVDAGWVRVDPTQLEQVVFNLAINAGDAMPDGGTLALSTAYVAAPPEHVVRAAGPHAWLSVSDTGVGMTEQTRSRIFEPFFTTKERGRGTGLGLSTAYGIVQQSGGVITVRSEPGRGSTFEIFLPAIAPAAEELVARSNGSWLPSAQRSKTAFIVEDDPMVRQLVRRTLEPAGYAVLEVASGEAALSRLSPSELSAVDVLVVDLVLPGLGGRDVARELLRLRPELPILFISGYADEIVARQGLNEQGSRFLAKPFSPAQLRRALSGLLSGEGGGSPS